MMKNYLLILIFLFLIGCNQKEEINLSNKQIIKTVEKTNPQVYKLINKNGNIYSYGSCFFIEYENKKYLITAYHIVDDYKEIFIRDKNDIGIKNIQLGKLQHVEGIDVALFETFDLPENCYIFKIKKSSNLSLLGYPEGKNLKESVGKIETIETNGEIIEGMSGGVVINEGYAIGIISARYKDKTGGLFIDLANALEKILTKSKISL